MNQNVASPPKEWERFCLRKCHAVFLSQQHGHEVLFLRHDGENYLDFQERAPNKNFWFKRRGKHLIAGLKKGDVNEWRRLDTSYFYFWNAEKSAVERTDQRQFIKGEVLDHRAVLAWDVSMVHGSLKGNGKPDHMDEEALIKGLPDGVFVYKDNHENQKGLAIEADSGGSDLSNSKGYKEAALDLKENWAKARGIDLVYIVNTQDRASQMRSKARVVWVMEKW